MGRLTLVFTQRSLKNLSNIVEYYEQKQPNLGKRFLMYNQQQIEMLLTMPNIGRPGKVFGTRELVLHEFPYVVVYRLRKSYVHILIIYHQSRKYPS